MTYYHQVVTLTLPEDSLTPLLFRGGMTTVEKVAPLPPQGSGSGRELRRDAGPVMAEGAQRAQQEKVSGTVGHSPVHSNLRCHRWGAHGMICGGVHQNLAHRLPNAAIPAIEAHSRCQVATG